MAARLADQAAQPLNDDVFDGLMADLGPFESRPHLAVAVSGGADSLCLAILAARWAARHAGRVTALSVDHGLRAEAGIEARRVGDWLKPKGIGHRILSWPGPKPVTGVQAAARAARYRLMGDWCRKAGVLHLALAHTLDDQAETFFLRLGAGSGPDGLAAMAAVRETADVRLLRPLLGVGKAALLATLEAEGQEWIEDPSNRDRAFARVRVRRAMEEGGLEASGVARAAHRFGRARVALEAAASALLARSVWVHPAGYAWLEPRELMAAPDEVSLRALGRVVTAVGGRDHGPRVEKLERLHGQLGAKTLARPLARTLSGSRIITVAGKVLVCREARGLPAALAARPGERVIWDRRFVIRFGNKARRGSYLQGLGRKGWSEIVQIRPDLRLASIPGPARASLPAVFDDDGVVSVPHLGFRRQDGAGFGPDSGPEIAEMRFFPPNSLSRAGFFLRKEPDILSL
jgi:tRNA(Ile)-lysidine synthase